MSCDGESNYDPNGTSKQTFMIIYYIFNGTMLWFNLPIVVILGFKAWKELKSSAVNIFKLIQWLTYMTGCLLMWIIIPLIVVLEDFTICAIYIGQLVLMNVILFQMSNVMLWLTLIIHLHYYRKLWKDVSYREIKKKIYRIEVALWVFFGLYALFWYVSWIFIAIVQQLNTWSYRSPFIQDQNRVEICNKSTTIWKVALFLEKPICYIIDTSTQIILISAQIIVFIIFARAMKYKLNYYYKQIKVRLYVLAIVSIWLLIFHAIYYIFISPKYLQYDFRIIPYKDEWPIKQPVSQLLSWIVYNILFYFPLTVYTLYNIENIDFKGYLLRIMLGFKILNHFHSCSLFIYVNRNAISETDDDISGSLHYFTRTETFSKSSFLDQLKTLKESQNDDTYKSNYLKMINHPQESGEFNQSADTDLTIPKSTFKDNNR